MRLARLPGKVQCREAFVHHDNVVIAYCKLLFHLAVRTVPIIVAIHYYHMPKVLQTSI